MIPTRLILRFAILSGAFAACQLSGATQCNGNSAVFNVEEEQGILSVTSQAGVIARTSDKGVTWLVGEPQKVERLPFWRKTFQSKDSIFHSIESIFQNVKQGKKMVVISKAIKEEFWSIENHYDLILFSKGKQLFKYRGDLYVSDGDVITLENGQLIGNSEDHYYRPIKIEVTPQTFCQLAYKGNNFDMECRHPFHARMEDHLITGFHALADGNFYISTYKDILYLDVAADRWSRIPPPVQWQCTR